jgi:DNA-binding CsgD family transcriptional regulator/tetratricopeptide (TPR) repeat protein
MTPTQLVGRRAELDTITGVIHNANRGGQAIVLVGEPGIGKSSVLEAAGAAARAAGVIVLDATGVEAEAALPFAGLQNLLRSLLGEIGVLPAVQQRALLSAFGLESGPAPELFLIALATLNLLTEVASARPVVAIVDDLQWVDGPTNDTLAFLARRIQDDAVVVIGAARTGYDLSLSAAGALKLELTGLDEESSREVLSVSGRDLDDGDRERILQHAMGNPLALVELPAVWRSRRSAGLDSSHVMPLSARLERAFAARIGELPSVTRDALLISAVDSEDGLAEILAATSLLSGTDITAAVLEPAEATGLVRLDEFGVRFRHPLVRSGVLQREPVNRRHAANAALAEVLTAQPLRRTWHRAQAIFGPDDEVADELELSHATSIQRGSVSTAIAALERSAQLSTDPSKRARRLLLAAQHAFGLGRADLVDHFVSAAQQHDLSELDLARAEWLREIFNDGIPGDAGRVFELCAIADRSGEVGDNDLALNLLLGAALRCWWADTGPEARARVVEVARGLMNVEDDSRFVAALAVAEPVLCGSEAMERLSRISAESVTDADALRLLGMAAHAVGDQARAADLLGRAEARLRSEARLGLLPHVLGMRGAVSLDLGDWNRAIAASEEGRRLASDTRQPIWSTGTLVNEARSFGLIGDSETALQRAAEAEFTPTLRALNDFLACAQLGRGYAYITAGRYSDAYQALRRVFDPADPSYHLRERFCGVMYLAEAAVHSGELEGARKIIAELEDVAMVTTSPLLHNQLLYARAVLAEDSDAETLYLQGLAADLTRWPWIRARIQLAYGMWLRRQRRVAESREPLRSALSACEFIGARTWTEQARVELRAAGERRQTTDSTTPSTLLSSQELQIARLAADGLSNREIGQQLYLSPRTVGSHLYRIFPKLGITSRRQLARRLNSR